MGDHPLKIYEVDQPSAEDFVLGNAATDKIFPIRIAERPVVFLILGSGRNLTLLASQVLMRLKVLEAPSWMSVTRFNYEPYIDPTAQTMFVRDVPAEILESVLSD